MKKLALLIFCVLFMFCSCSAKPAAIVRDFSAKATISYRDTDYKCLLISDEHRLVSLRFAAPGSVSGLCFEFKDGGTVISRDGLKISADGVFLPRASLARTVFNILSALGKDGACTYSGSYNELAAFKGSSDSGRFTLYTEHSTGVIKRFELENGSFKAELGDVAAEE